MTADISAKQLHHPNYKSILYVNSVFCLPPAMLWLQPNRAESQNPLTDFLLEPRGIDVTLKLRREVHLQRFVG